MWKVAVCDDERQVLEQVTRFLNRLQRKHGLSMDIKCFESGEDLMKRMEKDTDLLILDISMGDLSGIHAARLLREKGIQTCIIFLTTMVQYALQGYEVHAFSFIQKPLKPQQFERVVLEALQTRTSRREETISLQKGNDLVTIDIGSILYVETSDHTSVVVMSRSREGYNIGLNRLAEQLRPHGFGLCHKSYLVNYSQIKSLRTAELVMVNGDRIPMSKHRRKDFLEEYTRSMGEHL